MPGRRLFLDMAPLRRSRDFRLLLGGQLVSLMGTQLTVVAVPYQVYRLTHSSLDVGLVSLAQLVPLLVGSLVGGAMIDAYDRRRLILVVELFMACSSAGLAINADLGARLWPLFVFPALTAGLSGFDSPARNAIIPNLVASTELTGANAMFQVLYQLGGVVGPAVGGLLLAGAGVNFIYWVDVASFGVSLLAVAAMSPQRPTGPLTKAGLGSILEGFRYLKGRQGLQGAYLIDVNAMVFGMPRALFPALGTTVFHGGASAVGFLYAAPGAGAVIGAATSGWASRVSRQGVAVVIAVMAWGLAIAGFGLAPWLWLAVVLLAVAGWADAISAVFRSAIVQLSTPDRLRGRLSGFQIAVVSGGPRVGDLESGGVATAIGLEWSVVSGGLACVAGAAILALALPGFRRQDTLVGTCQSDPDHQP